MSVSRQHLDHEEGLITAARNGDPAAFDRLVRLYQDYLYRLMVRACHHPDEAEDVAAEAFERAYERLGQFEGRSSFVSWLGRIASNLCFRRLSKARPQDTTLDEAATRAADGSPERQTLQEEMRRAIREAIDGIPEPSRTVFLLRDVEQLSAAEVAERTGLTVAAVKARLHRARADLRSRLRHYIES